MSGVSPPIPPQTAMQVHHHTQTQPAAVGDGDAAIITVLLNVSPVAKPGRPDRLKAISESWGSALRNVHGMRLRVISSPYDVPEGSTLEASTGLAESDVFRISDDGKDKADRLFTAMKMAFDEGATWVFMGNDHTFVIPENLRCYVDSLKTHGDVVDWRGHTLQEGGAKGNRFLSGAAGYLITAAGFNALSEAVASNSCKGVVARDRSQPGLLVAKCFRDPLNVIPDEIVEDVGGKKLSRVHVYGPARMVSGQVDDWWSRYRKTAGQGVETGPDCCAPHTITFHYAFGAEQVGLALIQ